MTRKMCSSKRRGSIIANVAALVFVGGILSWFSFNSGAQEQRTGAPQSPEVLLSAATTADLENAFWLCDYAASTTNVDSGTASTCAMAYEELKNRKFNGDFEALLAWWQQNKPSEHRALEAATRANAATAKASPVSL